MIEISIETKELVRKINLLSNNKLHFVDDVANLVELSKINSNQKLFNELIFISKFMTKVLSIIKKYGTTVDGYDKLISEYNSGMEKIKINLNLMFVNNFEDEWNVFQKKYFDINNESLSNTINLLSDLSWVKNWKLENK
ncbi:MAG: hypothetical protein O3A55_05335 [Bacteroidetes bacterium]|nr:hypothetical protein [Bacteroidota bacterium]